MEKKIAYLTIAGLWVYVILRSVLVPITIDEAYTFFEYIQSAQWLPGEARLDANNHILNSALSMITYHIFGSAEWALRLPNLLAGLLYLILAWLLSLRVSDVALRWSLFLALSCTSFLLEFFGYTRGYGLSMAFLLLTIWSFLRWKDANSNRYLFLALSAVAAMVYSNMSMLITGLIIGVNVLFTLLLNGNRQKLPYLMTTGLFILGLCPALVYAFLLKDRGLLYYGQGESFWSVTVMSLSKYVYYPYGEWLIWMFPILFIVILILTIRTVARIGFKLSMEHQGTLPVLLLFGNITAVVLMKHVLGVNYPEDRVALLYLPLLVVSAVYLTGDHGRRLEKGILLVYCCTFPFHLLGTMNLSHSVLWIKDHPLRSLCQVSDAYERENGISPTVEGYRLRSSTFSYHNFLKGGQHPSMRNFSDLGYLADLVITENTRNFDLSDYGPLHSDITSGLTIYQRIKPWKRTLIVSGMFDSNGQSSSQFNEFCNVQLPNIEAKAYLFVPKVRFESDSEPPRISMKGVVSDLNHEPLDENEQALDRIRRSWKDRSATLNHAVLLDARHESAARLKVFLWNRELKGSYAASGTWELFALH